MGWPKLRKRAYAGALELVEETAQWLRLELEPALCGPATFDLDSLCMGTRGLAAALLNATASIDATEQRFERSLRALAGAVLVHDPFMRHKLSLPEGADVKRDLAALMESLAESCQLQEDGEAAPLVLEPTVLPLQEGWGLALLSSHLAIDAQALCITKPSTLPERFYQLGRHSLALASTQARAAGDVPALVSSVAASAALGPQAVESSLVPLLHVHITESARRFRLGSQLPSLFEDESQEG